LVGSTIFRSILSRSSISPDGFEHSQRLEAM
jgi:hypothetical protein